MKKPSDEKTSDENERPPDKGPQESSIQYDLSHVDPRSDSGDCKEQPATNDNQINKAHSVPLLTERLSIDLRELGDTLLPWLQRHSGISIEWQEPSSTPNKPGWMRLAEFDI